MKFTTCLAVFTIAFAFATSGCRYDKSGVDEGADIQPSDLPGANGIDLDSNVIDTEAMDAVEGGSLADLADAGKSFKDRGYALCTDVSFAPVYFGFDATSIRPEELGKVEAVARHLADNADRVVTIEGNCDERGSNEYNMSLGEDRAIIIGNFLAQNGISRDRIETVSRGETNPAAEGSGEAVWSQNRRGEFIIWKK